MRTSIIIRSAFALLLSSNFITANAQIKLPRLISDGMILQRDVNVKLWGWAAPAEKVNLQFNNKQYSTAANDSGKWLIPIPAQKAGGPYEMTFTSSNAITVKNILFGDVYVCSGQSNMELPMERVQDKYAAIIANTNNPNIRQFLIPDTYDFEKQHDDIASGEWLAADPKNVLQFSAVAYFFAKELNAKYKIPVGIINAALGGSPAEAWISEDAIKKFPDYYNEAQKFKDKELIKSIEANDSKASNEWYAQMNSNDEGIKNHWKNTALNDVTWLEMDIPGYYADGPLGAVNGAVWFRKKINVPASMIDKPARLLMGRIVDADSIFINGVFIGATSYQYPPRRYSFPAGVLKEGKNVIAIKLISNSGKGGFVPDKPYKLIAGTDTLDISGEWKYKLGTKMSPTTSQTFVRWKPTGLFNAMIAPLTNYTIKGFLWYQGEANTKNPSEYTSLMQTLIGDWRGRWGLGELPFIYVQLPNFMEPKDQPSESSWAALRQAQSDLQTVPHIAMAVAVDLGEWNDIHPLNKQDVGKRLALQAERLAYGDKKIIASGPTIQSTRILGNKVTVHFANTGSGLVAKGNTALKYFAIAGSDKKFVWAKATIHGNEVTIWNDAIANPVFVRYAWADNPAGANLYNKEGLPAAPFEAVVK